MEWTLVKILFLVTLFSDFDQSNLRKGYKGKSEIVLVCGLKFRVLGCQDRLRVNSDDNEAQAYLESRCVSEALPQSCEIFLLKIYYNF